MVTCRIRSCPNSLSWPNEPTIGAILRFAVIPRERAVRGQRPAAGAGRPVGVVGVAGSLVAGGTGLHGTAAQQIGADMNYHNSDQLAANAIMPRPINTTALT